MIQRLASTLRTFTLHTALAAALCSAPFALADEPPASKPADPAQTDTSANDHARTDRRAQPGTPDPELRKKFRDMLARRLDSRRREVENLDKAVKMLDEGKSFEDVRALFPDAPHPGQRGEGRDQWIRRWEEGGPGPQSDGPSGPGANGIGGPSRGPSEPSRPLTDDERKTVREILKETAPKTLDKLQELEKSKPEEAEKQYTETFRRSRFLLETRKKDPRMFDLRLQEIRHARRAGEEAQAIADIDSPKPGTTPAANRDQRLDELRKALRELYKVRTEIMQRDGQRMIAESGDRASKQEESIEKSATEMIDRAKRKDGKGRGPGNEHRNPGDDSRPAPKPQS